MWMGIDQGTTGTTCIAYDDKLRPVAEAYRELATRYPRPGWVEQEPEDIVRSVVEAVGAVLAAIGGPRRVDVVGLSNQGESVVAWDAGTGRALGPALVWSDRRGAETVARLERAGQAGRVQRETGLRLDAYFSAAKLAWLLEHDHAVREAAATGTLRLGTLDTWLAWRLGGGRMLTDHSTASRTQLLGLRSGAWEPELLDLFGVPPAALAKVRPSVEPRGALAHPSWGGELPWTASLVDQPAALAGHACFDRGDVKATYGTGCFVLVNAGSEPPAPPAGLLTSIAWSHDRQRVDALRRWSPEGRMPAEVLVSGGGVHNRAFMDALVDGLGPVPVRPVADGGNALTSVHVDAKEAVLFALLAILTVQGRPGNVPSATGATHPVVLGSITPGRRAYDLAGLWQING